MVSGFTLALFAVLDGFCRAVANAGHAMGAAISPDGLPIPERNVVQRTEGGAFPAGNAGIGDGEGGRLDGKVFFVALVPAEGGIYAAGGFPDRLFIIQMKGSWVSIGNSFKFFS